MNPTKTDTIALIVIALFTIGILIFTFIKLFIQNPKEDIEPDIQKFKHEPSC